MTTIRVQVSNVKWDFSDFGKKKKPKIPTEFIIEMEVDDTNVTEDDIEDEVSDKISDEYGFCHTGYSFYIIKPMINRAGE